MFLTSPALAKIPGIMHAFGSLSEPIPTPYQAVWETAHCRRHQVHGVTLVKLLHGGQNCGEADAFYSLKPGVPVAVMSADCVPILMARKSGGAVAAIHAGWRGTKSRIIRHVWDVLKAEGEDPMDWAAALGPSIGPCCYEVTEKLADEFAGEFAKAGPGVAVHGSRHLDLPAINAAELSEIGMEEIDLIRACTRCAVSDEGPLYHSYRREGGGTRQWSVISISASQG